MQGKLILGSLATLLLGVFCAWLIQSLQSSQSAPTDEETACRGPRGQYTLACLTRLWLEAGCSSRGTGRPDINPGVVWWWSQRSLAVVKKDMSYYRRLADVGEKNVEGIEYSSLCFGKQTDEEAACRGPDGRYTLTCLNRLWLEVGCSSRGTGRPNINPETVHWLSRYSLAAIRNDMAQYKRLADAGKKNEDGVEYRSLCFGTRTDEEAVCRGPDGRYTLACLTRLWQEAGCSSRGTSRPEANPGGVWWWSLRSLAAVKKDMAQYKHLADAGKKNDVGIEYTQLCFGTQKVNEESFTFMKWLINKLMEWLLLIAKFMEMLFIPHCTDWLWDHGIIDLSLCLTRCTEDKETACREPDGHYTLACLNRLWLEAGCSSRGTGRPDINPWNVQLWSTLGLMDLKKDMAQYKRLADAGEKNDGGVEYANLCFGTQTEEESACRGPDGNYTLACLNRLWLEAGCSSRGTGRPDINQWNVRWLSRYSLAAVKNDMAQYKRLADAGKKNDAGVKYTSLCFGYQTEEELACRGPDGQYTLSCLTRLWLEAGCSSRGTGRPDNNPGNVQWLTQYSLEAVKNDMSQYKSLADAGKMNDAGIEYTKLCFGTQSVAPDSKALLIITVMAVVLFIWVVIMNDIEEYERLAAARENNDTCIEQNTLCGLET